MSGKRFESQIDLRVAPTEDGHAVRLADLNLRADLNLTAAQLAALEDPPNSGLYPSIAPWRKVNVVDDTPLADLTDLDILNAVKRVDGAGSGLDADVWRGRSIIELDQAKQGALRQVIGTDGTEVWIPLSNEIVVDSVDYVKIFAISWFGGSLSDMGSFASGMVHWVMLGHVPQGVSGYTDYIPSSFTTHGNRLRFGHTVSSGSAVPNIGDTVRLWVYDAAGNVSMTYRNCYRAGGSFYQATADGSIAGVTTQPANFTFLGETR
jgi:hypothetical protein